MHAKYYQIKYKMIVFTLKRVILVSSTLATDLHYCVSSEDFIFAADIEYGY